MIAAVDLVVGKTVWFRGGMNDLVCRGRVADVRPWDTKLGIESIRVEWGQGLSLEPGKPGGSAWVSSRDLFSSAAAYHADRLAKLREAGHKWFEAYYKANEHNPVPDRRDDPVYAAYNQRHWHRVRREELAERVAALRLPLPAEGWTKTTVFRGRASGDGECFCFAVTEGESEEDEPGRLYPGKLLPPECHLGRFGEPRQGHWTIQVTFVPEKK